MCSITPKLNNSTLKYFLAGYTIPSGWVIMIATAGLHLNSNQFEDPLKFNPWRWKVCKVHILCNDYF